MKILRCGSQSFILHFTNILLPHVIPKRVSLKNHLQKGFWYYGFTIRAYFLEKFS